MPLILDESSGSDLLYFQKYHVHEKRLKDRMEAFLNATVSLTLPDQKIDVLIDEIYADRFAIRVGPSNTPIAKRSAANRGHSVGSEISVFHHFRWAGNR